MCPSCFLVCKNISDCCLHLIFYSCMFLSLFSSLVLPPPTSPWFSPASLFSFIPSLCYSHPFIISLSNNLFSLPSSSLPRRLLKVKPEERLTIEGVLAHPWLNCTEALDNVLPSAQMMMDKVSGKLKVLKKKTCTSVAQSRCWSWVNWPAEATIESYLAYLL